MEGEEGRTRRRRIDGVVGASRRVIEQVGEGEGGVGGDRRRRDLLPEEYSGIEPASTELCDRQCRRRVARVWRRVRQVRHEL